MSENGKWQYIILDYDGQSEKVSVVCHEDKNKKLEKILSDLSWDEAFDYMGKNGWEAFSVYHNPGGHYESRYAYFKRQVPKPEKKATAARPHL